MNESAEANGFEHTRGMPCSVVTGIVVTLFIFKKLENKHVRSYTLLLQQHICLFNYQMSVSPSKVPALNYSAWAPKDAAM